MMVRLIVINLLVLKLLILKEMFINIKMNLGIVLRWF